MPISTPGSWSSDQIEVTYEVRDAKGATDVSARDTDKFTINVKGSNDAPVASTTENKNNFGAKPEDSNAFDILVTDLIKGYVDVDTNDPRNVVGLTATNGTLTKVDNTKYTFKLTLTMSAQLI